MRSFLAALLCLPSFTFASCFVHPDSGVTYCTAAQECPAGTVWSSSGACRVQAAAAPTSGVYIPAIYYPEGLGVIVWSEPKAAFWTRSGNIVTVAGSIVQETSAGRAVFQAELPFPSRFPSQYGLAGIFTAGSVEARIDYPGYAYFTYVAEAGVVSFKYVYSYEVLP